MTLSSPARSALRLPYLAVRTPLGLLDEQVVVRVFGADSTAHRSLSRGLHTLDSCAAAVFAPPRSGAASTEAPTEPTASTTTRESADIGDAAPHPVAEIVTDVEPVDRDGGEQPIDAGEQQEIDRLADTFLAEDELAPRSGELAENDELRRVQAEIRAKQAVETEHGQL